MGRSPEFHQSYAPNTTINNILGSNDEKKIRDSDHDVEWDQRNRRSTEEERYYAPERDSRYEG